MNLETIIPIRKTLEKLGFHFDPDELRFSVARNPDNYNHYRYEVRALVKHGQIVRENGAWTELILKLNTRLSTHDLAMSAPEIARLCDYIRFRGKYLIEHGTFAALNARHKELDPHALLPY